MTLISSFSVQFRIQFNSIHTQRFKPPHTNTHILFFHHLHSILYRRHAYERQIADAHHCSQFFKHSSWHVYWIKNYLIFSELKCITLRTKGKLPACLFVCLSAWACQPVCSSCCPPSPSIFQWKKYTTCMVVWFAVEIDWIGKWKMSYLFPCFLLLPNFLFLFFMCQWNLYTDFPFPFLCLLPPQFQFNSLKSRLEMENFNIGCKMKMEM